MKLITTIGFALLCLCFTLNASEFQSLSGEEAYQIYREIPGKACQEYRTSNYVVYTKYQTNSCAEVQNDETKWTCTIQLELKNGKQIGIMSSSCSRQI